MRNFASGAATVLMALFPIVAAVCVHTVGPKPLIFGLLAILVLQFFRGKSGASPGPLSFVVPAVSLPLVIVAAIDTELAVRLYPVFVNAAMAIVFGASLVWPPTMIERFARLTKTDFPPSALTYMRKVTVVWVVFFILNGSIALWTVVAAPWSVWALYNGVIAYVLIGSLFLGEMCVRPRARLR